MFSTVEYLDPLQTSKEVSRKRQIKFNAQKQKKNRYDDDYSADDRNVKYTRKIPR